MSRIKRALSRWFSKCCLCFKSKTPSTSSLNWKPCVSSNSSRLPTVKPSTGSNVCDGEDQTGSLSLAPVRVPVKRGVDVSFMQSCDAPALELVGAEAVAGVSAADRRSVQRHDVLFCTPLQKHCRASVVLVHGDVSASVPITTDIADSRRVTSSAEIHTALLMHRHQSVTEMTPQISRRNCDAQKSDTPVTTKDASQLEGVLLCTSSPSPSPSNFDLTSVEPTASVKPTSDYTPVNALSREYDNRVSDTAGVTQPQVVAPPNVSHLFPVHITGFSTSTLHAGVATCSDMCVVSLEEEDPESADTLDYILVLEELINKKDM